MDWNKIRLAKCQCELCTGKPVKVTIPKKESKYQGHIMESSVDAGRNSGCSQKHLKLAQSKS